MNIPYVMRKCSKCGRWLVASTDNFHKQKAGKYGLDTRCKECAKKRNKQYYQDNKNKLDKKNKQWRLDNKDKMAEYVKQWQEAHKDKMNEYRKRYYQSPQGQVAIFNASSKRRHKKATQGTGVTPDQWLEMMQYFDFRCAYTGKRLTDKTRSGDHVVPLDAGGDDMVWNMVPMLRNLNSSKNSKNMEEWYREQSFYSEARLAKIYEWQEYARRKWQK